MTRSDVIGIDPARWPAARVLVAGAGISGLAAAAALVDARAPRSPSPTPSPTGWSTCRPGREPAAGPTGCRREPRWWSPAPAGARTTRWSPRRPRPASRWSASRSWPGGSARPGRGRRAGWWSPGPTARPPPPGCSRRSCAPPGRDAVACGNIGYPVVDAVQAGHPVLAVELSSFQLHWSPSVRPAAGCVLNVAEDHLDWHGSMAAYAAAKARALRADVAVAGVDDPVGRRGCCAASPAPRRVGVTLGEPAPDQLGVRRRRAGRPGVRRRAADSQPTPCTRRPARRHRRAGRGRAGQGRRRRPGRDPGRAGGLPARPAPRRRRRRPSDGVRYVDDSKATNPHAAAASLAAVRPAPWSSGSSAGCSRAPRWTSWWHGTPAGCGPRW